MRPPERKLDHVLLQAETVLSFSLPQRGGAEKILKTPNGGRLCVFVLHGAGALGWDCASGSVSLCGGPVNRSDCKHTDPLVPQKSAEAACKTPA